MASKMLRDVAKGKNHPVFVRDFCYKSKSTPFKPWKYAAVRDDDIVSARPSYQTWKYPSKQNNQSAYPPPYCSQTNRVTKHLPKVLSRRKGDMIREQVEMPRYLDYLDQVPPKVEISREFVTFQKPKQYTVTSEQEYYSYSARLEQLQPNRMRPMVDAMDFRTPL